MKVNKVKDDRFSLHETVIVTLLALTQFSVILDFMVISPLGDMLMKSLNISTRQFGFAVSCYAFSAATSALITAGFADLYDRKRLLLFFYSGFIVGTLCCSLAPSYPFLIFGRIVTGLFGGVIGSISLTIATDLISLEKRGRAMGLLQMGFGASQVLGLPVGIFFANKWGWHAPFLMIVMLGLLIALALLFYLKPITGHLPPIQKSSFLQRYLNIFQRKTYRSAFLFTATVYIGGFLMQPFASTFFINNLNIRPAQLPFIFFFSGISSLTIMPIMGKLSDMISKAWLFAIGSAWAIIFSLIYTHLPPIALWILVIINICQFMGVLSRNVPATATISAVPDGHDRGAFMSINSCIQQFSGGLAAVVAGLIVKQKSHTAPLEHFTTVGYVSVGVMLFSIWMMFRVSDIVNKKQMIRNV